MKKRVLIICILTLLILSSCSKESETPKMNEDKEKPAEELAKTQESSKTVVEDIEKIMEKIEEPILVEVKDEQEKKQEESENSQSNSQEGGGESQEEGQQPLISMEEKTYEEKKEEENNKKQEEIEKMWMDTSKKVEGIHTSWNNYKVTAIEDGADSKSLAETEDVLNRLTIAVGKKELMKSFEEGNNMMLSLASFFDVYKGNIQGDLNNLTYIVGETYLQALQENWDKAQTTAKGYEESFSPLSQKIELDKKDEKHLDTLEISIRDLINSIKYKDADLVKIKRDVVLKNIEKLNEVAK